MTSLYRCPICQTPLAYTDGSFRCQQSHCFDRAKEGYVNLLPVQFKHSKEPGDNKAMVNARRDFLEKGYYQPLADKLIELQSLLQPDSKTLLDAGCGEGYYTKQFAANNQHVYGIDIAKEAVKKAAKKYQQCHFSVATLSHLPFDDESIDAIVSIYAPILPTEFYRVLSPNGILITVTPGKNHLHALKQQIYQQVLQHDEEKTPVNNMELIEHCQIKYAMKIVNGQDLLNLLSMTPFAFKANDKVKDWLALQQNFSCEADFNIRVYKKTA